MSLRTTSRKTVKDSAVIAVAMGVMNLTTYGFTIIAKIKPGTDWTLNVASQLWLYCTMHV